MSSPQSVAKDTAKAIEWYEKAARQGSEDGKVCLAMQYILTEDPKAHKKEFQLCMPLAKGGSSLAMCALGIMYADGVGVPQSDKLARKYFQQAIDAGNPDAAAMLAEFEAALGKA